jgi:phage/plasmid-associated DNA primase
LDVVGLNFANGFVTEDLVLRAHAPEFGATYTLPYLYHTPDETIAPQMWLSFLHSCWGEDLDYEEKVQAVREAIAVTLFGLAPEYQRAICAFGVPHSGKSVLIDIVLGLVTQDMTSVVRPHDWSDKFLPTQMMGKLINFCGELSEHELIPGDRFKQIIDGHELDGQYKGRDIFKFRPRCAHWFSSNHLPRSRDSSAGFTRRWLFLTFNKAVPPAERVQGLAAKILAAEREQIVAWAVSCMPRLKSRNGYTLPQSHRALADKMAELNNSVRHFLLAGGVQIGSPPALSKSPKSITATDLHAAYWGFCKTEARAQPVSLVNFQIRMQELASELGFGVQKIKIPGGGEAVTYLNVTLARAIGARA